MSENETALAIGEWFQPVAQFRWIWRETIMPTKELQEGGIVVCKTPACVTRDKHLQQKWRGSDGGIKWVDVPTVEEEDE